MFNLQTERPIVNSLLDVDFYKFTMGQLVFHRHPNVQVRYELIIRNEDVNIADEIEVERFIREIDNVTTLRANPSEISYMRGIDEYGARMFKEDYLYFFANLQLPKPKIVFRNGKLVVIVEGLWCKAIYWETIVLCIISELRSIKLLAGYSDLELQVFWAQATVKLHEKLTRLRKAWDSGLKFFISDFSTRRRGFFIWQDFLVQMMAQYLTTTDGPKPMYRGTSNTYLAFKHGQLPMGTIAHEAYQGYSGIYRDQDDRSDMVYSQRRLLNDWSEEYPGGGLDLDLPDTFGTPFFLQKVLTPEMALERKGMRQDSGNPFTIGNMYLDFYRGHGIDPMQKQALFSDGLTVDSMLEIANQFYGQFGVVGMGPGSHMSNDFGFPSRSMVMKLTEVEGHPVVKLSDNLAKKTGKEEEVERVIGLTGYQNNFTEKPTY